MKNLNNGPSGREIEPVDVLNKSETLVIMLIMLEEPDCGDIPSMYLGGMCWHAGDANRPGNRADALYCEAEVLRGQVDESADQMDTLNVSNSAEMVRMSCGDEAGTYLGARDVTDGVGSQTDGLSRHLDMPSVEMNLIKPVNEMEIIRTC